MQCNFCKFHPFNLQAFDQLAAEVQTSSRRCYSTFILGIYRLVALFIFFFRLTLKQFRQWGFAHTVQHLFKGSIITVKKETDRTATGSSVINYFCY
ncbi:hypothetical protein D3C80_2016310 [compost metagenome]